MRERTLHVVVAAGAVVLCAGWLAWIGWPAADRGVALGALMLAASIAGIPAWQPIERDWPALRAGFLVEFTSLVTLGVQPAIVVGACGVVTRVLVEAERTPWWQRSLKPAIAMVSLVVAASAYQQLGGGVMEFRWPWEVVPVAGGVLAYCLLASLGTDMLAPRLERRAADVAWRAWPLHVLYHSPVYLVTASVSMLLVTLIGERDWQALSIAALPLLLAYGVHWNHVNRIVRERRRAELIDALHDGVCTVDRSGLVTLWNDALARISGCPAERAVGRPLQIAFPTISNDVARAIQQVANGGAPRSVGPVSVRGAQGVEIFQVKLVPVRDGVSVLWQDVAEHARANHELKRQLERVALAAEAANDGLWEWDLATDQFFVTGRWKATLGLPPTAPVGTSADWLDRVHPEDLASLKAALDAHVSGASDSFEHAHRLRHEDGTYRSFRCRAVAGRRFQGRASRIAGSLTDTTDLALTQERLRNAVFVDPLTGLCNRAVFVEHLGHRLSQLQQRPSGDAFALLYLDLDRFKLINDSLGHLVGDELLVAASRRLESCLREGDLLSRLGGDEFAILLNSLRTDQQANVIALRVQETLSKPFSIGGREVFTSASIGIAVGMPQYASPDEMMHAADTAMYQAKANGKARHEVFDEDMDARARDRLGLENDLRYAVDAGAIETHYQPIVLLASGMCVGFESLSRWTRDGKPVSPATFIPIAEELGLIDRIGARALEEACHTFSRWQRTYPDAGLEYITVNASARQLMQHDFVRMVERAVRQADLQPAALRVEITETALVNNFDQAAEVLKQLRDFGVKIYLDDFGTGYSSLSHLHKLPVDTLKIDRSFVRTLSLPNRPAIVESVLALARTLHTSVVAEGIESDVQARELEALGCTHAQGYLFSRALSAAAAEELVAARRPLGPKGAERVGELAS